MTLESLYIKLFANITQNTLCKQDFHWWGRMVKTKMEQSVKLSELIESNMFEI